MKQENPGGWNTAVGTENAGSMSGFDAAHIARTRSVSGFRSAGAARTARISGGSLPVLTVVGRMLPVLAVLWGFVLHFEYTASTRSVSVVSTAYTASID